jgi:hypothetical protein
MLSEGNAVHPGGCDSPLQIVIGDWRASNLRKSASNGHYYMQRAVTPDQIIQQNITEGRRAQKAVKTL